MVQLFIDSEWGDISLFHIFFITYFGRTTRKKMGFISFRNRLVCVCVAQSAWHPYINYTGDGPMSRNSQMCLYYDFRSASSDPILLFAFRMCIVYVCLVHQFQFDYIFHRNYVRPFLDSLAIHEEIKVKFVSRVLGPVSTLHRPLSTLSLQSVHSVTQCLRSHMAMQAPRSHRLNTRPKHIIPTT